MKKKPKTRNWGLTFVLLVFVLLSSCSPRTQDKTHNSPDSAMLTAFAEAGIPLLRETVSARDFSLPLLSPEITGDARENHVYKSLHAQKGNVVLLYFWATWCGPCRAGMIALESLYNLYKDRGLEILAVNISENEAQVQTFALNNQITFPILLDSDGRVSRTYGVRAIPTIFLVDREGRIMLRKVGSPDWNSPEIHAALDYLFP